MHIQKFLIKKFLNDYKLRLDFHLVEDGASCNVTIFSGSNGSGKTTVLKAIRSLLTPQYYQKISQLASDMTLIANDGTVITEYTHQAENICKFYSVTDTRDASTEGQNIHKYDFIVPVINGETPILKDINTTIYGISIEDLSFGEQAMRNIFITAANCDPNGILLLDCPEYGLHIDMQEYILDKLCSLFPNLQIIITTHSPSLIINGYQNLITYIDDIKEKI